MTTGKWIKGAVFGLGLAGMVCSATADDSLSLWYQQPAEQWGEALPLANL